MKTTRIINGKIVNEGLITENDILIKNNRIKNISKSIKGSKNEYIYDAKGKLIFPGMIDAHVHFREPGLEKKGTINSESGAAVSGGITSIMEMPNTKPAAITNKILEEKFELAKKNCISNYSFYLGASNSNFDELNTIDKKNVCGIKLFLGSSTGNLMVDSSSQIEKIFKNAKVPVALHCEVDSIIKKNEKTARELFGEKVPFNQHGIIRSEDACYQSSKFAVELAKKYGTQIHILHMTTAKELGLFSNEDINKKNITVEACPHHLWFYDENYDLKGSYIKCNPSIKTLNDRNALRKALVENIIDTVGTDHAPHLLNEKENTYFNAPSGMPVVQSAIPSLLEFLPPTLVVQKTSHNPSMIFKCKDRGFIREDYFADLTIIDNQKSHIVNKENINYKCKWSPFNNIKFSSSVISTFVNGELAYDNDKINYDIRGMRLQFDR
jgi:dihydroorotase